MHTKLVFPLLFVLNPGYEHSYTETVTEPTCTEQGYTTYTCSCGDSYEGNIVPALGHDFVLIGQNGTIATYQCSRCGYTYNEIVTPNPPVEEISLDLEEGCSDRTLVSTITERHEYVYASGRLMREVITTTNGDTVTTQILDFIYGSGSTLLALVYTNGTDSPVTYYYVTNIQGDVVKLVTAGGTVVASYSYDAWGKVLSATGDMAEINPIQYRGYYYDVETELYYLQSRYYDPAVKRFVNADVVTSTGYGFTGNNMFAYCNDNPVLYSDTSGYVIELSEDATDEQIQQYERAIEYLKQSKKGRALIEKLENAEEVITIVFVNDNETMYTFDGSNRVIRFDVDCGHIMSDGVSVQSAAVALAHEMGHAVQHLNGDIDYVFSKISDEKTAVLLIEEACLATYETPIAKELGEPTRGSYLDPCTMVTMNNSTHFVTFSIYYTRCLWLIKQPYVPSGTLIRYGGIPHVLVMHHNPS